MAIQGTLALENSLVFGMSAEIISVLRASSLWSHAVPGGDWSRVAHVLDTRNPAEERAPKAVELIREIQTNDEVARWIARFDELPEAEFRQDFYPAYRDHSVHTLQTWLLGLYLYETVGALREPLSRALLARSACENGHADLFRRWWTIAVFWHDSGYPFESEGIATNVQVRRTRLTTLEDALSKDGYRSALTSLGCPNSGEQLAQIHRAGRYVPVVIETVEQILREWDDGILGQFWDRLGMRMPEGHVAAHVLDDLTIRGAASRPPYHDHGTFGALLLLKCARDARIFLEELDEGLGGRFSRLLSQLPVGTKNAVESSLLAFMEGENLVNMAVEAIAFHNLDFRGLDPAIVRGAFPNGRSEVNLEREPHVVFLALVDTLQDWDRHHFFPQGEPTRYRPATRSDEMLLQGFGQQIRVTLGKRQGGAASEIRRLFSGWISGLDSLFVEGARFSRPMDITSGVGQSLAVVDDSAARLRSAINAIEAATERARVSLIQGAATAVLDAANEIEPALLLARESRERLQASDQKSLDDALSHKLGKIEQMTLSHIDSGTILPIGRVIEKIGEGGFGKVWRIETEDRSGARYLAFKVFHGHDLGDVLKRGYFTRGYRAMQALRFVPGVVRVENLFSVPFGLSMEYVAGTNLEDGIRQVGSIHDRVRLLKVIAETLAASHQKGVIHRDVKPANVLLDARRGNEPVLTDFDLACISGKTTLAKAQFANHLYGAPEQFDEKLANWSSQPGVDVYSFGALSYYVLTNRNPPAGYPFSGDQWELVERALEGQLPADAVAELIEMMTLATERDPRSRLTGVDGRFQMEDIVARLSNVVRVTGTSQAGSVSHKTWLNELCYAVSGRLENFHGNHEVF